jgi:hypothetical protein
MSAWTLVAFGYLYIAGFVNGILIIALDEEAYGAWPPLRKILLATLLWPLLTPYVVIGAWMARK